MGPPSPLSAPQLGSLQGPSPGPWLPLLRVLSGCGVPTLGLGLMGLPTWGPSALGLALGSWASPPVQSVSPWNVRPQARTRKSSQSSQSAAAHSLDLKGHCLFQESWMASPETDSGFVGSETSRVSPLTQTPEHRLSHIRYPGDPTIVPSVPHAWESRGL